MWIVAGVIALLTATATMIRVLGGKKKSGEAIGWLDVALAFAQGIDDAKGTLPPEASKLMTGALKKAADEAGKHGDVTDFLTKFGFNQPKKP